jgi:phosphate transport system protein
MRENELDQLVRGLVELMSQVGSVLREATIALLDADDGLARAVLADDEIVALRQSETDAVALGLLLDRDQPVATDLRTIVACLRMTADLRRMAALASDIARIAHLRHPRRVVDEHLAPAVMAMADHALRVLAAAGRALADRNVAAAAGLACESDETERLQQELYRGVRTESRRIDTEDVVNIALVCRCYERYAEHAVELANGIASLAGARPLDTAGPVRTPAA